MQGDLLPHRQLVPLGKAQQQLVADLDLDPADVDAGLLAGGVDIGGSYPEQGRAEKREQSGLGTHWRTLANVGVGPSVYRGRPGLAGRRAGDKRFRLAANGAPFWPARHKTSVSGRPPSIKKAPCGAFEWHGVLP